MVLFSVHVSRIRTTLYQIRIQQLETVFWIRVCRIQLFWASWIWIRAVWVLQIFFKAAISAFFDGKVLPTNQVRPMSQSHHSPISVSLASKAYRLQLYRSPSLCFRRCQRRLNWHQAWFTKENSEFYNVKSRNISVRETWLICELRWNSENLFLYLGDTVPFKARYHTVAK